MVPQGTLSPNPPQLLLEALLKPLGAHGATPSLFGPLPETPPVKPIALPTADDVRHTLPGFAYPPPEGNATVLLTKPKMKDWTTGQNTSPMEAITQLAPPTALVVELTSPIAHLTRLKRKDGTWWL